MNWVDKLSARTWSILVIGLLAFAIGGCEGSTGPAGPTGATGATGPEGPEGPPGPTPEDVDVAIANADAESCGTCHSGTGDMHQAEYAKYIDESVYVLTIDNVDSNAGGAGFDLVMDFSITLNGAPYIDADGDNPSVDMIGFYVVQYLGGADFVNSGGYFPSLDAGLALSNGDGSYTLSQNLAYDILSFGGGAIVGKIGVDELDIEDKQYNPSMGKRVKMYDNLSTDAFLVGNIDTYESVANVEGCEACHGAPYRKHGNYDAEILSQVDAPDFLYCKACHTGDRSGGHEDWQYMVDDPFSWATGVPIVDDGRYDYQAELVNDTHMSHAMEFPYPQSMANCDTCHAGKLDLVLADENFDLAFCKSCHVVEGVDAWPDELYEQPHRPPPMTYLWANSSVPGVHNVDMDCQTCHGNAGFSSFSDMHSGYDKTIYDANGDAYSDTNTVAVENVAVAGNLITVDFSSTNVDVVPTLAISFYGWDSKHYIIAAHERDGNGIDCPHNSRPGCNIEWSPGSTKPFFTEEAGSVPGDWSVTFDMSLFQAVKTDPIPQLIADGVVKYFEVSILPVLDIGADRVNLLAVSETYDFSPLHMPDYFQGANDVAVFDKCVDCHDNLSALVHSGSGRFGDSMQVCKACHATTFPGSHIEMASRSIDSYVHAIHTFQPFDEDDVADDNDPVFNARNAQHKNHVFPNFTALSCEGCHAPGVYNVPDQSKSLFGVQSASYDIAGRSIGTIPESVTGPASRACGGCHRANMIIEDMAGDLATFDAHVDAFGTFEENDADDEVVYGIIDKIMSLFQ